MSAESAVHSLISQLKSLSSSYRGSTYALIDGADTLLASLHAPAVTDIEFESNPDTADLVRVPRPPTIKTIRPLLPPTPPLLQEVEGTIAHLGSAGSSLPDAPDLTLPGPVTTQVPLHPVWSTAAPSPGQRPTSPDFSDPEEPAAPALTEPRAVSVSAMSGTPPEVPMPDFADFTGDYWAEFTAGLQLVGPDLGRLLLMIRSWHPNITELDALLASRLRAILAGTETAVTDTWETAAYGLKEQETASARREALQVVDDAPGLMAATGMPSGGLARARLAAELAALQTLTVAAGEVANRRADIEVTHTQWAMKLIAQWVDAAFSLQLQTIGWQMKAMRVALEGGEAALNAELKLLEFKEKELAFIQRYNETQVRRVKSIVELQKNQIVALKIAVASNQLAATYNEHQTQVLRVAMGLLETRLQRWQSHLDWRETAGRWELLALRRYQINVAGHAANVRSAAADYAVLNAQIDGDTALARGETAKVHRYRAQIKAWAADIDAQVGAAQAATLHNQALLNQFDAELSAKLAELKSLDEVTRLAVEALMAGYQAEENEMLLQFDSQSLANVTALDAAGRDLADQQVRLLDDLKQYELRVRQAQTAGKIMDAGAATLGGIALHAYAGLNSVGAKALREYG